MNFCSISERSIITRADQAEIEQLRNDARRWRFLVGEGNFERQMQAMFDAFEPGPCGDVEDQMLFDQAADRAMTTQSVFGYKDV